MLEVGIRGLNGYISHSTESEDANQPDPQDHQAVHGSAFWPFYKPTGPLP